MGNKVYKTILEQRQRARELHAFRPGNMSDDELAQSSDLEYIGGEFSTFDIELSRLMNSVSDMGAARDYMKQQITGPGMAKLDNFAAQLAFRVFECICQNQALTLRAIRADVIGDINAWNDLFQFVIDRLDSDYNPRKCGGFIDVMVIDSWADVDTKEYVRPMTVSQLCVRPDPVVENAVHYDLIINRQKVNDVNVNQSSDPAKLLIEMIKAFSHEYMHFLDYVMPNRGALGAQFAAAAKKIYASDRKDSKTYRDNPLEITAFKTAEMLRILDTPEKH